MKNEKERLIEAIENLNKEKNKILNSKEYILGKNLIKTIEYIKKFQFHKIKNKLIIRYRNSIDKKKLQKQQSTIYDVNYDNVKSVEDKRIVVYTCITGNYDKAIEPLYHNDNVDYIIYTNSDNIILKECEKRKIPENVKKLEDNVLMNRYIKMHPNELFEGYDYSIYIDGNVRTISDVSCFINQINEKTGLALHRHYARNCIWQEVEACKLYKKGNLDKLQLQIEKYQKEGLPKEYGLLECNVIVSDLKNYRATEILNEWWNEFYQRKSMRDQISLPYVLWKLKYQIDDVGNLGSDVRKNPKIEIVKHNER